MKMIILVPVVYREAHGRAPELEKSDFRPGSESGLPLIRFQYENCHFGARATGGRPSSKNQIFDLAPKLVLRYKSFIMKMVVMVFVW